MKKYTRNVLKVAKAILGHLKKKKVCFNIRENIVEFKEVIFHTCNYPVHTDGKFLKGLGNFMCNKTSIFANVKIVEESSPCEMTALKRRS